MPAKKQSEQKPAPSAAKFQLDNDSGSDPWGAWSDHEEIEPSKVDYTNFNLNKLSDKELNKHKKAMDQDFNRNKIDKDHPEFEYDKRKDFSKLRQTQNFSEDDW